MRWRVFLPPMSGLAAREHREGPGGIYVLIGEGQTAQVLRNLCWQLSSRADKSDWVMLARHMVPTAFSGPLSATISTVV